MPSLDEVQRHLEVSAKSTNGHEHSFTCRKGQLYRRGDHFSCRLGYDLCIVWMTCLLSDCMFAIKRSLGMLPAYIPALQLVYPANHTFQLSCEAARFLRDHQLWEDARVKNPKVSS